MHLPCQYAPIVSNTTHPNVYVHCQWSVWRSQTMKFLQVSELFKNQLPVMVTNNNINRWKFKFYCRKHDHTPNIQVKHALQIFDIRFVFNDSTMKCKCNGCCPKERRHTEEMSSVTLSRTKEAVRRIPVSSTSQQRFFI